MAIQAWASYLHLYSCSYCKKDLCITDDPDLQIEQEGKYWSVQSIGRSKFAAVVPAETAIYGIWKRGLKRLEGDQAATIENQAAIRDRCSQGALAQRTYNNSFSNWKTRDEVVGKPKDSKK